MRRNALQLSRRHKAALYLITFAVFASGVAWWLLDRFAVQADEFGGLMKSPAEPWMLKIHGAAAMLILVVLGTLLPIHVKRSWQAKQNLLTGVGLLGFFGILTLTGYGLYYASEENVRALTSNVHLWVGFALPAVLVWHVWRGHSLRRRGKLRLHKTAGAEADA